MTNFWKSNKPIIALAPMAGLTDSAFRQLCRKMGADVVYTEMISCDALHYKSKKTLQLIKFDQSEKPIVGQLFGKRPQYFGDAAARLEQAGYDGIDINFGCPARKVVRHGGGVTLMKDFKKCRAIIESTLSGTKLPVSIKIRSQIEKVTAYDFVKKVMDLPIAAIMIHGRPYSNPFNAPIDFAMIKKVKQLVKIPVLGNGGINTPEEAKKMLDKTGCDGLGLARGVRGQPWLFQQIKQYQKKEEYHSPTLAEIKKISLQHARLNYKTKGKHGIIEMRKHLIWYTKGWPEAAQLRQELVQVKSIKDIEKAYRV